MATARELRELHDRLVGALGDRVGGTMIEVLEQMATRDDLAGLATTRDLHDLETRIDARFDREGRRIATALGDVRAESASVRGEVASMREEMASQFGAMRHEIAELMVSRQTVVLTVIATIAALAAVIVGVVAVV